MRWQERTVSVQEEIKKTNILMWVSKESHRHFDQDAFENEKPVMTNGRQEKEVS